MSHPAAVHSVALHPAGLHPAVEERLARLAPDQRAAATASPGPVLCVAPAGSGKTTTLVARIAWLIAGGVDPAGICAVTFNKRAADELGDRLATALQPLGIEPGAVRVRTFHALGREMLQSAGRPVEPLVDRGDVLRALFPRAGPAGRRAIDDAISRFKLDRAWSLESAAAALAADPAGDGRRPDPLVEAFVAYERHLGRVGAVDFDDFVAHALRLLDEDAAVLAAWRRTCAHLLVDEVQDVDRSQLQLALRLAAPANRIFLVGDDDQSIYGWRLADVRRVLSMADALPGLRRIDLVTNYRCPRPVVVRAVRLIEGNAERFVKEIRPRAGATGRLVLAPEPGGSEGGATVRFLRAPLAHGSTRAVLARTNRELLPPLAEALELGLPFRAPGVALLIEDPLVDGLLAEVAARSDPGAPLLIRLAMLGRRHAHAGEPDPRGDDGGRPDRTMLVRAMLGWAAPYRDLASFEAAIRARRARLAELRRDDAPLTLATAHGTKGLEFDDVAVIGLDDGRFPSARSLADAPDPARALEEERRLAYVAWTRARQSLTLIYDPAAPSPFLLEAFTAEELNLPRRPGHAGRAAQRAGPGGDSGRDDATTGHPATVRPGS